MAKYSDVTLGYVESIINKLGGKEMADALLRDVHPLQLAAISELHFRLRVEAESFAQKFARLRRQSWVDEDLAKTLVQDSFGEMEIVIVRCLKKSALDLADAPAWMRDQGLEFVDPFTLMDFNAANPEFSDKCPNLTLWPGPSIFPAAAKFETRRFKEPYFELRAQQHRTVSPNWWLAGTPIM